jgi:hypothetical protein
MNVNRIALEIRTEEAKDIEKSVFRIRIQIRRLRTIFGLPGSEKKYSGPGSFPLLQCSGQMSNILSSISHKITP